MDTTNAWPNLLAVLALIAANGFFVAAEFALVSVRPTRIDQLVAEGHPLARIVQRAKADPNHFLLAAQIGITLASLALGWIAEPTIATSIVAALGWAHATLGERTVHAIATALTFTLVTYLHIVLGENIPKALALQRTEQTIFLVALPMEWLTIAFTPFIWFLDRTGSAVMRVLGIPYEPGYHTVYSPEEIKRIVSESHEVGVLQAEEQAILARVFDFADKSVRDVMVPRTDIHALPSDLPGSDVLATVIALGHSRYPVFDRTLDDVLGILHVKDLMAFVARHPIADLDLTKVLREVRFVPENKPIPALLAEFREARGQVAIVMDEYGGTAGMVTVQDILEEIFGEIHDEFAVAERMVHRLGPQAHLVDGRFRITLFNERFGTDLATDEFDTVAGWVFGHLGHEPVIGDDVTLGGFRLVVDGMAGHRITRLRLEARAHPKGPTA